MNRIPGFATAMCFARLRDHEKRIETRYNLVKWAASEGVVVLLRGIPGVEEILDLGIVAGEVIEFSFACTPDCVQDVVRLTDQTQSFVCVIPAPAVSEATAWS